MSLSFVCLIVGSIFGVASFISAWIAPQEFFKSYLFAFSFWCQIPLGALALLAIAYLTGGKWTQLAERPLKAAIITMPVIAILFFPVIVGMAEIYPWVQGIPEGSFHFKQHYLTPTFFILRSVFYLACWLGLAALFMSHYKKAAVGSVTLLVLAITLTFAFVDWIMSIEYEWESTAYGVIFMLAACLSTLSFILVVLVNMNDSSRRALALNSFLNPQSIQGLGKLMLTLLLGWVYISFMQYLVYWSSNKPNQVTWYLNRIQGGWEGVLIAIAIFHVAIPFFALLSHDLKKNLKSLGSIAALIFIFRIFDVYWYVIPAFFQKNIHFHWTLILTFLGVGGIWLSTYFWALFSPTSTVPPAEGRIPWSPAILPGKATIGK